MFEIILSVLGIAFCIFLAFLPATWDSEENILRKDSNHQE